MVAKLAKKTDRSITWPTTKARDKATAMLSMPTNSGMPAAISAPKTNTRTSSATGSPTISACSMLSWLAFVMSACEASSPVTYALSHAGVSWSRTASMILPDEIIPSE